VSDSRITRAFERCREQGRAALVGYLTGGDPDLPRSAELLRRACDAGLDVLELGVPFSDPIADGPRVQSAMVRALRAGASLARVLELARQLRAHTDVPIVLFSYANPLLRDEPNELARTLSESGIDGVLVVDLPPEHNAELRTSLAQAQIDWVGLVAPTTSAEPTRTVAAQSTGFVYAVTLKGVTGARLQTDDPELQRYLGGLRELADRPVAAGFGVRTPDDVAALSARVDGVVVGSALIEAAEAGPDALAERIAALRAATARS
jgi:tryptophan synthase alpha chain